MAALELEDGRADRELAGGGERPQLVQDGLRLHGGELTIEVVVRDFHAR